MAAIDNLMVPAGADIYYSDAFRNVLEDHMTYLRGHESTTRQEVEPIDIVRYQADLFGLLGKMGIPPYMHWVVMRMTDLTSPSRVPDDLIYVLVPDEAVISRLQQTTNAVLTSKK